eukprot:403361483
MIESDSKNNLQVSVHSPSKALSYKQLYFKQLTSSLEPDLFKFAILEVNQKNEQSTNDIAYDLLQIGQENPQQFLEEERQAQVKADIARIKAKNGLAINSEIKQNLMLRDLSQNFTPKHAKPKNFAQSQDALVAIGPLSVNQSQNQLNGQYQNADLRQLSSDVKQRQLITVNPIKNYDPYEFQERQQETRQFVKKLNIEKKQREMIKAQKAKMLEMQFQQDIIDRQLKLEYELKKKDLDLQKKREETEKRIQDRIQKRYQSHQRMIEETRKISHNPKLYKEIEQQFSYQQQLEEEERLQKLQQIREQYQPKSNFREEIEGHYRKYDEIIREKRDEYKRKRGGFDQPSSSQNDIVKYKSKFYEEQVHQDREFKYNRDLQKEQKKKLQGKVESYAKYVKEMYGPQPSDNKREELEYRIQNMKHPVRQSRAYPAEPSSRQYQAKRQIVTADYQENQKLKVNLREQDISQDMISQKSKPYSQVPGPNGFISDIEPSNNYYKGGGSVIASQGEIQLKSLKIGGQNNQSQPQIGMIKNKLNMNNYGYNSNQPTQRGDSNLNNLNNDLQIAFDESQNKFKGNSFIDTDFKSGSGVVQVSDKYIDDIKQKLSLLDQI